MGIKGGNTEDVVAVVEKSAQEPVAPVEKTPEEIYQIVKEVVRVNGANFLNHSNASRILKDAGLKDGQVSDMQVLKADMEIRLDVDSEITWPKEPEEDGDYSHWISFCKRYCVSRAKEPGNGYYFLATYSMKGDGRKYDGNIIIKADRKDNMAPGQPTYYKSLDSAIKAAEKWHCRKTDREVVRSNREAVVSHYSHLTGSQHPSKGVQTLPSSTETATEHQATATDGTIAVPEKKEGTKRRAVDPLAATDKFGCAEGSSSAAVNAVLTTEPKSKSQIVKDSGLSEKQVRYSHLNWLVEQGFAVKIGNGWALKS